jgi:hypothetical protein
MTDQTTATTVETTPAVETETLLWITNTGKTSLLRTLSKNNSLLTLIREQAIETPAWTKIPATLTTLPAVRKIITDALTTNRKITPRTDDLRYSEKTLKSLLGYADRAPAEIAKMDRTRTLNLDKKETARKEREAAKAKAETPAEETTI